MMSLNESEYHSSIDYVLLAARASSGMPVAGDISPAAVKHRTRVLP